LLISVAVPVPTLDLLTYRIAPGIPAPAIGARVIVPLGSRVVTGIVVDVDVSSHGVDESEIKPIRQFLESESFVPPEVVALARWTAEYYAAGAGETITSVLPPKTRGGQVSGHKTRRMAAITAAGLERLALRRARGRRCHPVPIGR
jgi:primosomal protein N' (replication factor Y) (superfamily II helicase)